MRIGIFGGTFDPIHYGHLLLAESCREQCQLDEIWFVPAATPPHKRTRELSPARERLAMLELAIAGHPSFRLSSLELDRGGVSYTVDTLEAIRAERPADELFLLMGADSLRDLPTWREPARLCEQATLVVVMRHGSPAPDLATLKSLFPADQAAQVRSLQIDMPVIELSSSDIRKRVAAGNSIRFRTTRAVEAFIDTHQLYKGASP
jgi:nicotinate-nucleotide adenylyltransferase